MVVLFICRDIVKGRHCVMKISNFSVRIIIDGRNNENGVEVRAATLEEINVVSLGLLGRDTCVNLDSILLFCGQ